MDTPYFSPTRYLRESISMWLSTYQIVILYMVSDSLNDKRGQVPHMFLWKSLDSFRKRSKEEPVPIACESISSAMKFIDCAPLAHLNAALTEGIELGEYKIHGHLEAYSCLNTFTVLCESEHHSVDCFCLAIRQTCKCRQENQSRRWVSGTHNF